MKSKLKVYSDGASRGNPGPSAIAFMILNEDEKILKRHSRYVGIRTNNQAEYEALTSALESASKLTSREVDCYLDSELVVKHLNGEYQVKNPKLKTLWLKVQELKQKFQKTSFTYVPRTDKYIEEVDWLANQTLDRVTNRC
jgi:ribonuclease HI